MSRQQQPSMMLHDQVICAGTLNTHQPEVESEGINESANYTRGWSGGQIEWAGLGSFSQDTGETPPLCDKCPGIFFMTSMSQDLGLTSSPKDGRRRCRSCVTSVRSLFQAPPGRRRTRTRMRTSMTDRLTWRRSLTTGPLSTSPIWRTMMMRSSTDGRMQLLWKRNMATVCGWPKCFHSYGYWGRLNTHVHTSTTHTHGCC